MLEASGWFHTGDLGEIDDEGFVRITGRKKEILVTAGGKNVAPAVLEDRIRAHPLVDQCLVVGDGRPFIAALVTLDREALPAWAERHDKTTDVRRLVDDPDLNAEIERAVEEANKVGLQGRVDPPVPDPRRRVDRGGWPAHPEPQAQAQRRDARGPRRGRGPLRALTTGPDLGTSVTPVLPFPGLDPGAPPYRFRRRQHLRTLVGAGHPVTPQSPVPGE